MQRAGIALTILLLIPLSGTTQIQKSAPENKSTVVNDLLQIPAPAPIHPEDNNQSEIYPAKETLQIFPLERRTRHLLV
jgi:hypothetical protein